MSQVSFQYRALDRAGAQTRGVIKALDREDAYRRLQASGMKPLRIVARRIRGGQGRRINCRDVAQMTHQFAVLSSARIPIVDAFRSIAEQEARPRLRVALDDIADRIESGSSVTEAMSAHRDLFGDVYVETIRAAEVSGNMIDVLESLAEMLERQHTINKNVKGALTYPICVVIALTIAICFLMVYVVPRFSAMFEGRSIELPLPTRIVQGASLILRTYWYLFVGGAAGVFFGLRSAWRNPTSRVRIDHFMHRVPYLRVVIQSLALSRFAKILGLCLRSGINLIDSLEMAGKASARPMMIRDARKMCDQVDQGGQLAEAMSSSTYLTPFARKMIAAGEAAGDLPRMCEVVGNKYDEDVEHLTKNVSVVIEPLLIVGLAGMVLVIALAVFLPMWSMIEVVG